MAKKKSKTEKFNDMLNERDREQRDIALYNQLKKARQLLFASAVRVGAIMKIIEDEEIYKRITGDTSVTFQQFCAWELPQAKVSTIRDYIKAAEILEQMGIDINPANEELDGYAVNKVKLLKGCEKPQKYLKALKEMPVQDFKKYINKEEYGIESADDEIPKHIAKAEKKNPGCPLWVYDGKKKKWKCKEGVC